MALDALTTALQRHKVDTTSLVLLYPEGPDELYQVTMAGADVIPLWHTLRGVVDETGFWPVVLGDDEDLALHLEELEDGRDTSARSIIEEGLQIDTAAWIRTRLAALSEYCPSPEGSWPDDPQPCHGFEIPFHSRSYQRVHLALVPATAGWQAPALLRFGCWNDCPCPATHVAMLKRWGELYGVELVGISHAVVELLVADPPGHRAAALALAWEQYAYCSDIVHQGVGTVSELAGGLLDGTTWYFWWD